MDKSPVINAKVRKNRTTPLTTIIPPGKIPPNAKEIEILVLGAILIEKGAFDSVSEFLKPECFYLPEHEHIFSAMTQLSENKKPIDIATVAEQLTKMDMLESVGGVYYLTTLTNRVASSAHLIEHGRIVLEKFIQRELIRFSNETIEDCYDPSSEAFNLMDTTEEKLFEITNNYIKSNYEPIKTILNTTIERITELRKIGNQLSGVSSGYKKLDEVTHGWQKTDLIILAARPSVGKTAFALNLLCNAAMHPTNPTPVGFFSLEMSSPQLAQRILSIVSGVDLYKISRGDLKESDMKVLMSRGFEVLNGLPIYIDDTPAINIFELRAKCRRLVNLNDVGLIIIDYLQLMSGNGEKNFNREQQISRISRDLKSLSKELDVPIIAISQLSREVERRGDKHKIPLLSDLRESGAIEQDADLVMFLYRPEYHEVSNEETNIDDNEKGETHLRIAKHRNGRLDNVKLKASLETQKFEDWIDIQVENFIGKKSFSNAEENYKTFKSKGFGKPDNSEPNF